MAGSYAAESGSRSLGKTTRYRLLCQENVRHVFSAFGIPDFKKHTALFPRSKFVYAKSILTECLPLRESGILL